MAKASALHHDTKVSSVSPTSGVSSPKSKAAYAQSPAQPGATALVAAGQKALATRAKKVLTAVADPMEAP